MNPTKTLATNFTNEELHELIDRILHLHSGTYLYGGVSGNCSIIRSAYGNGDVTNYRLLQQKCFDAVNRKQLSRNQNYAQIVNTVFSTPPFTRRAGSDANMDIVLTEVIARQIFPGGAGGVLSEANLSDVINDVWDSLSDSNQGAVAASDAAKRRLRQISEMTGGDGVNPGTRGFSIQRPRPDGLGGIQRIAYDPDGRLHDPVRGQVQMSRSIVGFRDAGAPGGFDSLSNEAVDALYQEWVASERFKKMSVEELRAAVKEGKGATTNFGKPSLQLPSLIDSDEGALINERTGEEIKTQKELIRYINNPNDPYAGRRLITHRSSGRVIPAKKARFESVIRGDVG